MENKTVCTLVFLVDDAKSRILLAMKKRGFGMGKWNGYGGKVKAGESIEESAIRELKEEACIDVAEDSLKKRAIITFYNIAEQPIEVHTYFSSTWNGEATETEEMRPQWYAFHEVPYAEMWADDVIWLPQAIAGVTFIAKFWFKDDLTIDRYEILPVKAIVSEEELIVE